jgi:hypothetical protein
MSDGIDQSSAPAAITCRQRFLLWPWTVEAVRHEIWTTSLESFEAARITRPSNTLTGMEGLNRLYIRNIVQGRANQHSKRAHRSKLSATESKQSFASGEHYKLLALLRIY